MEINQGLQVDIMFSACCDYNIDTYYVSLARICRIFNTNAPYVHNIASQTMGKVYFETFQSLRLMNMVILRLMLKVIPPTLLLVGRSFILPMKKLMIFVEEHSSGVRSPSECGERKGEAFDVGPKEGYVKCEFLDKLSKGPKMTLEKV